VQKTRMAFAAAAALAMVVAAGCGSSGGGSGGSGGETSQQTSQNASTPSGGGESTNESPSSSGGDTSASGGASASGDTSASGGSTASSGASDSNFACDGKSGDTVPTKLVLALVPSGDSQKLVETAKPLTDYLTKALGVPVTGVVSTNYAAAVEAMGADQAQIGMFAPLPMIQACQKYGAKIVLQSVRFGSSTYHTQFFTNDPDKYCTISKPEPKAANKDYQNCNGTADAKTGPVALDALKNITPGTKVGLLDPGSTSGYIFPSLALINQGIDPKKDIEIVALEGHDQSVLATYNGDDEVGVSYDDARDAVAEEKKDVGQKVVVFAYSDEIPNDGVVVSGNLNSEWQTKITKTLEDYSNTEAGKKVLGDIYQIDSLAPAVPASLGKVAEAVAKLGLTG